jgi:hypothetical protein
MPDPYAEAYLKSIQEARKAVMGGSKANDALLRLYARMISDINKDLAGEAITAERAQVLERKIKRRFSKLAARTGKLFENTRRGAVDRIIKGHEIAIERAASAANVSGLSVSFNGIPDEALDLMMARRGLSAKNYKSVLNRGLKAAAGDIEDYLTSAIGRGVNARRASQELAGILSRNNEAVLNLVNDSKLTKSTIKAALKTGGITPDQFRQANKILYDSRRIIVTETNTAYRQGDLLSQERSPVVKATKWQISGRHNITDSCDYLHEADQFGLGAGVFPTGNVPGSQHPFCLCHLTSVLRSPSEWGSPKMKPQRPPTLTDGQAKKFFKGKTDNYIKRQKESINYYQNLAYEVKTGAGASAA